MAPQTPFLSLPSHRFFNKPHVLSRWLVGCRKVNLTGAPSILGRFGTLLKGTLAMSWHQFCYLQLGLEPRTPPPLGPVPDWARTARYAAFNYHWKVYPPSIYSAYRITLQQLSARNEKDNVKILAAKMKRCWYHYLLESEVFGFRQALWSLLPSPTPSIMLRPSSFLHLWAQILCEWTVKWGISLILFPGNTLDFKHYDCLNVM